MSNSVYPCLWFDNQAKEAASFYCSVFKDSKIVSENPLVVMFEVKGQQIMALNGGPKFKFNEAMSIVVACENQQEIDIYWNKLTANGGEESMCGWLKDKYGLSWQIVPANLNKLMSGDPAKTNKVVQAFLQMRKFDIAKLEEAYNK